VEEVQLNNYGGLPGMDERTLALFEQHLKRGVPVARGLLCRRSSNLLLQTSGLRVHHLARSVLFDA
jgi:hypothetical protein